jgi:hypothetical protein
MAKELEGKVAAVTEAASGIDWLVVRRCWPQARAW